MLDSSPANMVLEDSDVEMIVAEIEVSVSTLTACIQMFALWICWIMLPAGQQLLQLELLHRAQC